jgi:hypothetical protein
MNGPTRAPGEETAYDEGITPRQGVIIAGLLALIFIAVVIFIVPLG